MFEVNAKNVREALFKRGWSLSEFARNARLHDKTCRSLLRGARVTIKTVAVAAAALGVDPESLILGGEAHD